MSLPTSRNTTYAASSPVKSADLNDLQDVLINLWSGKHGDVVEQIHASKATVDGSSTYSHANQYVSSSGPAVVHYPLDLKVGDRIKSFSIARYGDGANNITVRLIKMTAAGTASNIQSATITAPAASWGSYAFDISPDITVASGESFALAVELGATGMRAGSHSMTKDHP